MADARLRSEWLGQMRFDDLTDAAWRVFTSGLMWSVGNGTNGEIPKRYLRYLHPDGSVSDAIRIELVKAGVWSEQGDAFVMVDWAGAMGQSTAEQVEAYKENARERQRRRRERAKQRKSGSESGDGSSSSQIASVTSDVTRDVTANVGTGTGTGDGLGDRELVGSAMNWPTRVPGDTSWMNDEEPW